MDDQYRVRYKSGVTEIVDLEALNNILRTRKDVFEVTKADGQK